MKQSKTFIPTMRETPTDTEIASHQLLLRAGYIRQHASGIYHLLPLAKKVIRKIEAVIQEEMEKLEAVELAMPIMQSSSLLEQTGRWSTSEKELFKVQDHNGRQFAVGPSQEELITSLISAEVNSYKKLPLTVFQIASKFIDEQRPRHGLLRSREDIVKDAYSFHTSNESLQMKYDEMRQAYANIFARLNLQVREVVSLGDGMNQEPVHQFFSISEAGEEIIAYSDSSSYAATIETAEVNIDYKKSTELQKEIEQVDTKGLRTIKEVAAFLNVPSSKIIKTLIVKTEDGLVAVLIRGDHELNMEKLRSVVSSSKIEMASEEEVATILSCNVGSIGPVKLPIDLKVYADNAVASIVNGICGANINDVHLVNVNAERDYAVDQYADLRIIQEGDPSPDGKGTIRFAKGIDVGRVSKLGTIYSEALNASYVNEEGKEQPFVTGSYRIYISRIFSALVEQFNDANGIKWPKKLAPYDIHLLTINMNDEVQKQLSEELYHLLTSYRYNLLHDDRDERAGVKFSDADLIGLPIRLVVGKRASEGMIEVKFRDTGETVEWQKEEITEKLQSYFRE